MSEREFATQVVADLAARGHVAYWAGGCVRDQLLGLEPADYDVATSATPDEVEAIFRRTIAVGKSFGVIDVLGPRPHQVQVATFRSDGSYSDGRRPDTVTFCNAEEDAKRRDFTINGMFFDPVKNEVIDYVGGQADLRAKVLRAIGDPHERFKEDKLRMLRAVRMAARFNLAIDSVTAEAIREMAEQIHAVSPERIAEETRKILKHPARAVGIHYLFDLELADPIFPEFAETGFDRGQSIELLEKLPADASFESAFALLFRHLPSRKATELCRRLRLSNEERVRIEWLIANQAALHDVESKPFSAYQPLVVHDGIRDLIALNRLLRHGVDFVERLLIEKSPAELNPAPYITGKDLTDLGLKPGPEFGRILAQIWRDQLDGKFKNREEAMMHLWLLLGLKGDSRPI